MDSEAFVLGFSARSDDLLCMRGPSSSIADNGNTYFKCVSIILELNFASGAIVFISVI